MRSSQIIIGLKCSPNTAKESDWRLREETKLEKERERGDCMWMKEREREREDDG